MDDNQHKRLIRLLVIQSTVLLVLFSGIFFWFSYQLKELNSLMANNKATVINGVDGRDGRNGIDGLSIVGQTGKSGTDGKDGQTTVINNTVIQNVPVPGDKGEKGDAGQSGAPGKEVQLSKDADGNILWKYSTDRYWQTLDVSDVSL